MRTTWILISDAHRARCFERDNASQSLTELADFIYPQKTVAQVASGGDLSGAAGKGHGRTGHAGTKFEPQTDEQAKARASFAHQLAHYLNQAVAVHECPAIVLIASSPMLVELRPALSSAAEKVLKRCIASDLTHFSGPELNERVARALQLPE
jgi:protein required for attachment to host cells